MGYQARTEKMQQRQNYRNIWHTDLMRTIQHDPPYCCLSCWCGPCVSYMLRRRALYNDMSRYQCCGGYMPCSGRCGESRCPECCLATETQHKIEMDKRDGKFGPQPMAVPPPQQMSRIDQPYPAAVGYPPPPPPAQGQPNYPPPPPAGGYPQAGTYPPTANPPTGYPPAGYQR